MVNDPHAAAAISAGKKLCDKEAKNQKFEKGCGCCYVRIKTFSYFEGYIGEKSGSLVEFVLFEKEKCSGKKRGPYMTKPEKSQRYNIHSRNSYEIQY